MSVASVIGAEVAADAIDEFLANLERAGDFSPEVKNLVGSGEIITFRTYEGRQWCARLHPEGFEFVDSSASSAATVSGTASELLLVLYRRRTLEATACVCEGDHDVLERWLSHSALM